MLGLIVLCLGYVLSQFYRAFLAVLADPLEQALGATPDDLATASGLWFLSFAIMQLPVGWALDRIGPRRTASVLMAVGGAGGAALFALATTPLHISASMLLIGTGCSAALMSPYYIFAREYPPARFATLAALMLGVGSAGNLIASWPMAFAAETFGWRAAMWGLSLASLAVAAGTALTVRDPEAHDRSAPGSLIDLLKMPLLWPIFLLMFVNYAPTGTVRGLWIGPYLGDIFSLDTRAVGTATLVMAVAMIAGTFAVGPLDRLLGTRKWVIFAFNGLTALAMLALALLTDTSAWLAIALLALAGFFGGSYPVIIAHGRAFFPPHLVGRGVTLMNLFGIGGVAIMQFASGRLHTTLAEGPPATQYAAIFAFFGAALAIGTLAYLFSRNRLD